MQIVAHQVELGPQGVMVGRVDGHFRGRQCEDQPAPANIHGTEAQDVSKERPVGVGVLAVQQNVSPCDHDTILLRRRQAAPQRFARQ